MGKHFIIFTVKMGSIHTSGDQYRNYQDDRSAKAEDTIYTASNGAPVPHPYEAQRAGENGPLLLQDFHLIDLLSHFDRERIPERVVHAKGSGAHGVYRTTDTLEDLCLADMFQPGKECPITVRFSTVGGESGSHDCARDPRGFSVKFRTDEGNWDLVANNTPVFFLRDPAKFPHFIHTQKRDPSTHLTHADDSTMFWDYLSQNPESVHQVMILMGDRGIPDGYRHMHGYLGHTVKLINKKGEWVYCQFHMQSQQGVKFITQEDSANYSPDYSQKDLYESIEKGDFPKWSLEVQTMTSKQAEELWETDKINVFDLTHVWPKDIKDDEILASIASVSTLVKAIPTTTPADKSEEIITEIKSVKSVAEDTKKETAALTTIISSSLDKEILSEVKIVKGLVEKQNTGVSVEEVGSNDKGVAVKENGNGNGVKVDAVEI